MLFCSSETCVSEDEDEDDEDENNEGGNEEVDDLLYEEKECEELELRGKNLYEAIESESVVALYTPTNVSEHFYLCYVIEKCIAGEDIQDNSINQHDVLKGSMYLRCKYYKKDVLKGSMYLRCKYYKKDVLKGSMYLRCKYYKKDVLKGSMYLRCKYYKKEDCESKGLYIIHCQMK